MKKTKYFIILHLVLAAYSFFGIASKLAGQEPFLSWKFILLYGVVILNLGIYAIVWQQLIKKIPLVTAYANKAVTVVWGIVWGFLFFQEDITPKKIIGAVIVIIGIIFVILGDREPKKKANEPAEEPVNATDSREAAEEPRKEDINHAV